MGRWTQYDEDAYRLPAGMRRTGYDADTGCYYFSDRSGNSYTGQPGSQYGPMVAGNNPAPTSLRPWDSQSPSEPEPSSPEKSKRRATLSNVPSAFRSLRHTLTTARGPWRRDQSSGSDDEEPVLVSRPSSPLASAESTTVTPSGPSKSARTASTARKPESLTLSSSPPAPPPKDSPSKLVSKSSTWRMSKVAPLVSVGHPRSASTSVARSTPLTAGHSRRAASEYVPTMRLPIAEHFMRATDTPSKDPAPGPATKAPKLPLKSPSNNRRHASQQTPSSPASARPTSRTVTSSRPRTSAPLARSVSMTAEAPRTSRTLAMAHSVSTTAEAPRTSRTLAMALASDAP